MNNGLLSSIIDLILKGDIKISLHGYEDLANDKISVKDTVSGIKEAVVVEEYLDFPKGPCVLVLQKDSKGNPVHAVWGVPAGHSSPAVLVTAYRPIREKWSDDYLRRKK